MTVEECAPYRARFHGGPVDGMEFMVPSLAPYRFVTPRLAADARAGGDLAKLAHGGSCPPAREPVGKRAVYVFDGMDAAREHGASYTFRSVRSA